MRSLYLWPTINCLCLKVKKLAIEYFLYFTEDMNIVKDEV